MFADAEEVQCINSVISSPPVNSLAEVAYLDVSFLDIPKGSQRVKEIRADDTLNHVYIVVLSEDADNQRQPQSLKV